MSFIRTKDGILDMNNTNKCIYVIRDKSKEGECRYVSYLWDNWRAYYLIDYQNCMLFSYNSAQIFISDLMKENLEYQNLIIELSPYYKDCRQSSNLADLCDNFVRISHHQYTHRFINSNFHYLKNLHEYEDDEIEIYGCIWTDKGLIYVAKMNDKGKLVLI